MNRKGGIVPESHLFPFRSPLFKPGSRGWEGKGKHLFKEGGVFKGKGSILYSCCVGQNGIITTCIYFFPVLKKIIIGEGRPLCIRHSLGSRH